MSEQGVFQSQWTSSQWVSMMWCGEREREQPDILSFIPKHSWTQTREGHDTNLNMGNRLEPIRAWASITPAYSQLTPNPLPLLIVVKHVTWRPQKLLFLLTIPNLFGLECLFSSFLCIVHGISSEDTVCVLGCAAIYNNICRELSQYPDSWNI